MAIKKKVDDTIAAANEFLNPEVKKARLAQEQLKAQQEALQAQQQPQPTAPQVAPPKAPPSAPKQPQTFTDSQTGELSGFTDPRTDQTFFGASPMETVDAVNRINQNIQTPQGAITRQQAAFQEQQQVGLRQNQQLASSLFQQFRGQQLPPEMLRSLSPSQIDAYQAIATGGINSAVGAIGGAAAGAAAGTAIGGPLGAAIGAIGGVVLGIKNNIGAQLAGDIAARELELTQGQRNIKAIISDINTGGNMVNDVQLFHENLIAIQRAHAQLKLDTQRDLAKFTGKDGTAELARYDLFFNYTLPLLERELNQAINNPNPNKILVDNTELNG